MPLIESILGSTSDFPGRTVDPLILTAAESGRPRVRRRSEGGRDLDLALPRGTFLCHGDVLCDDGETIVAVVRRAEPALVIPLTGDAAAGLALGYLLGNQHSQVDVCGAEVRVPLVTSAAAALDMLHGLGLHGSVRDVPLAEQGWWSGTASHHHGP